MGEITSSKSNQRKMFPQIPLPQYKDDRTSYKKGVERLWKSIILLHPIYHGIFKPSQLCEGRLNADTFHKWTSCF